MGTALSGMLQGFADTTIALQKYDDRREQERQKIELLKQRVNLRRDIVRGRAAHLKLQDQLHAGRLEVLLRRYGRQIAGGQPPLGAVPWAAPAPTLAGASPPDAPDGAEVLPEGGPNLVDLSQPAALVYPQASASGTPLQRLSPEQILGVSDESIAGLRKPEDLAGLRLSAPQLQALRLRLARRPPMPR